MAHKQQPSHQKGEKEKSFLRRNGSFITFLLGMALIGFLVQFQWIGYIVVIIYAVIALLRRIPARTTFILALVTLAVVPVAVLSLNELVARNFAAYSFALLVFGVISTVVELRRELQTK